MELRRELARARPEAFGPYLATSLNNLSIRLADLGRSQEALRASEEAVGTLAPHFLALPRAFESWMRIMLGVYDDRCAQTETSSDESLVSPLQEALAHLDDASSSDS